MYSSRVVVKVSTAQYNSGDLEKWRQFTVWIQYIYSIPAVLSDVLAWFKKLVFGHSVNCILYSIVYNLLTRRLRPIIHFWVGIWGTMETCTILLLWYLYIKGAVLSRGYLPKWLKALRPVFIVLWTEVTMAIMFNV